MSTTSKIEMYKKFDSIDQARLDSSLVILQSLIKQWSDARPENKNLQLAREAIITISVITSKMALDSGNFSIAMEDYRLRSLRSTERARKADVRIDQLEKEINLLKKKIELGL